MRCALAALVVTLALSGAARADMPSAQAAFDVGAYSDAARAGEAAGGGDGLALAASALVAQSLLAGSLASPEALDRALSDGERALALAPRSVDARLSIAVALGMKGRRASLAEAWARGYAQRGRRLIEEALAIDPGNARARALLGGWHFEVLRRAGSAGGLLLGAHYDRGRAAFDAARSAAPDDPAIAFHYALALLALNSQRRARRGVARGRRRSTRAQRIRDGDLR